MLSQMLEFGDLSLSLNPSSSFGVTGTLALTTPQDLAGMNFLEMDVIADASTPIDTPVSIRLNLQSGSSTVPISLYLPLGQMSTLTYLTIQIPLIDFGILAETNNDLVSITFEGQIPPLGETREVRFDNIGFKS